jgi:D-cysteine desulfhydrase
MSALYELFPKLGERAPRVPLGVWPTPVERAVGLVPGAEIWLKRDDASSATYGGSKLRLLEQLFGEARRLGATRVYSSGAIGSNFAEANALHAPRAGLEPAALCFPQPLTAEAARSHRVVVARAEVVEVAHWSLLPLAAERVRRREPRSRVLSQVTFSAESLFGYVSAGLELAQQIAAGECPAPQRVVLPVGSAATSAGLLAGLSLAKKLGIWPRELRLCPVRIAAWPLSRRGRVRSLAAAALGRLAELAGDASLALFKGELLPVELVTDQLGTGYPHGTEQGAAARAVFAKAGYPILDETYSAKAAAHLLASARDAAPVLFWSTKSSAPALDG